MTSCCWKLKWKKYFGVRTIEKVLFQAISCHICHCNLHDSFQRTSLTLFKFPYQRSISLKTSTLLVDTVLPRKYHEKIFLLSLCNLLLNAQDTFNNYITKSEFICRGNEVKSLSTINILLHRPVSRYIFENCLILRSDENALSNGHIGLEQNFR